MRLHLEKLEASHWLSNSHANLLLVESSSYLTDLVMSHLMIVEVAAGCESLPTHPALVRFLPRVDPPVSVEAGAGAEPFLTLRADVGLLASVGPVMCNVSVRNGPGKPGPTLCLVNVRKTLDEAQL